MERLPEKIERIAGSAPYTVDSIGMSGAGIRLYRDMALKVSRDDDTARREAQVMMWLRGRLPVPEVLAVERANGRQYLLMTRLPGRMLCDGGTVRNAMGTARLLAQAIEMLGAVETGDCPYISDLDATLALARGRVERGEVDVENTDPATFAPGGFRGPEHLLNWLEDNRPDEKIAFTHGDMSLPNVFAENGRITGFLDLGGAGLGDPWRDYAIARRSLHDNTDGHYGHDSPGFDPDVLFKLLGVEIDREKLRYYTLLDELF